MQQVSGIQHAAALLGNETLKSFATAVSMRLYFGKVLHQPALERVWKHCLATAACCELLANAVGLKQKDKPYVAGLLHDIGCLGMMVLHPKNYADLLASVSETGINQLVLEADRFGFDHCVAGEWIARNWKLGPEIEGAALHHHSPPQGTSFATLEIVKVSVLLVDSLGWSSVPSTSILPVEACALMPRHFREAIKVEPEHLCTSIAARIETLQ
jgi:HD-like signal output (HDOD) protein